MTEIVYILHILKFYLNKEGGCCVQDYSPEELKFIKSYKNRRKKVFIFAIIWGLIEFLLFCVSCVSLADFWLAVFIVSIFIGLIAFIVVVSKSNIQQCPYCHRTGRVVSGPHGIQTAWNMYNTKCSFCEKQLPPDAFTVGFARK